MTAAIVIMSTLTVLLAASVVMLLVERDFLLGELFAVTARLKAELNATPEGREKVAKDREQRDTDLHVRVRHARTVLDHIYAPWKGRH